MGPAQLRERREEGECDSRFASSLARSPFRDADDLNLLLDVAARRVEHPLCHREPARHQARDAPVRAHPHAHLLQGEGGQVSAAANPIATRTRTNASFKRRQGHRREGLRVLVRPLRGGRTRGTYTPTVSSPTSLISFPRAGVGKEPDLALVQPPHPQEGEEGGVLAAPHKREDPHAIYQDRLLEVGRRGRAGR